MFRIEQLPISYLVSWALLPRELAPSIVVSSLISCELAPSIVICNLFPRELAPSIVVKRPLSRARLRLSDFEKRFRTSLENV